MRQKKHRRGGKASLDQGGAQGCSQGRLDKALASVLTWQQSAEERWLSLEEARLEKEFQAEERRQQQEERRAEQERQHELRLFSMLTGALVVVKQGAPTTTHASASPVATAASPVSSSLSQPPSGSPPAQAESTLPSSTSVKACKMSLNDLETPSLKEAPSRSIYLSNRGNSIRKQQGILGEGFAQYETDRYHETDKPDVSVCHVRSQMSDSIMTTYSPSLFVTLRV